MLATLVVLAAGASAAPARPEFPQLFVADFSAFDSTHGYGYTGRWAWDLNNARDHQATSALVDGQVHTQTWVDLFDAAAPTSYFWCQRESACDRHLLVPPMRPFALPADSEFVGNEVVDGTEAQHWRYTYGGEKLRLVTDYLVARRETAPGGRPVWFPLRTDYSGTQPRVSVNWTSVEEAALPASEYEIPAGWGCQPEAAPVGVLNTAKAMARGSMAKMDAAAVPREGMGAIARMMGSASLRAGLLRGATCSPAAPSDL